MAERSLGNPLPASTTSARILPFPSGRQDELAHGRGLAANETLGFDLMDVSEALDERDPELELVAGQDRTEEPHLLDGCEHTVSGRFRAGVGRGARVPRSARRA